MNCKDDAMAKVLGVEWCAAQIRDLLDHGIPSVHFYSLNATQSVKQVASKIF
jgi:methylenetetrahydrofolate reductase (NADPH)